MKQLLILFLITNFASGQTYRKVEIFPSSKDVVKGGIVIDSLIAFNQDGDNDLHLKTASGKKFFLSRDSVWGYRTIAGFGEDNVIYRYKPNWGWITVYLLDDITFYSSHEGKGHALFYLFSKKPYTRIYRLTKRRLNKVYKSDEKFLAAINKEVNWNTFPIYNAGDEKQVKQILEIYKRTHQQ